MNRIMFKQNESNAVSLNNDLFAEKRIRAIIIEDEAPAYNRLCKLLDQVAPEQIEILDRLESITAARKWFAENPCPDLLFMDIHLADGSCFDLLKYIVIDCPIIFTTAYDQYTLEAFKTYGIDYLLKPVKKEDLLRALRKFNRFERIFGSVEPINEGITHPNPEYKKRFIIRYGEHIKTLDVGDIAYCFSTNKSTCARTFTGQTYPLDYNLDALEEMLDPVNFFRVNRQYLTHIRAIDEMKTYSKGRVFVSLNPPCEESLIVSSEKSAKFKRWLGGEL
ncbi:MAG TPA: LytTR family DNA-binding domain-containing protein [Arachidicoccus sp.]|nr:LytTR family DNA-binding domain-containing protein [Arachidicoccus sp.]